MIRKLFFTAMIATLVALSAAQPLFAQDRTPDPAEEPRTEEHHTEEHRPGDERDLATGDSDGSDAGYWEMDCWEEPDDDIIYCDDVWVEGTTGDWNGDGEYDTTDF